MKINIYVVNGDSFNVVICVSVLSVVDGGRVVVLNMVSYVNFGGGWLRGVMV